MSYSRRQLEAFGEPLGESVTQVKPGGNGRIYGGGGGGPTSSTVTQTNIPEYARPYVEAMLGASMQEAFNIKPTKDPKTGETTFEVLGAKPFRPYSLDPREYIADFSPLQQAAFLGAQQLQVPGQIGMGSDITAASAASSANLGQRALGYGQQAADIGAVGLLGAAQGLGAGKDYISAATSPAQIEKFTGLSSPYQQAVIDRQIKAARDQAEITREQRKAQFARAGGYGGGRQAIEEAEARKALESQIQGIQAQGLQKAYDQAIQQQQFGAELGLRGLGAGYQGLGTALQGQQQGMAGVGMGLQALGQAGQFGGQLGQLGMQQQQAARDILGLQQQFGAQQQAQQQQLINQSIQNYATAQQQPQQQLGFLNAMIRGMATPTTTVQSYQAAPPITSQLAGLGALAYGLGNPGTAAATAVRKKGGPVHSGGGLNDLALADMGA